MQVYTHTHTQKMTLCETQIKKKTNIYLGNVHSEKFSIACELLGGYIYFLIYG